MKIDPDIVPASYDEAMTLIMRWLEDEDRVKIKEMPAPGLVHFSVGAKFRNAWSLWDRRTPLVLDYRRRFKLFGHGDDVSATLVQHLIANVMEQVFDPEMFGRALRDHWARIGVDPLTGGALVEHGTPDNPVVWGGKTGPEGQVFSGLYCRCSECLRVSNDDNFVAPVLVEPDRFSGVLYCKPCFRKVFNQ